MSIQHPAAESILGNIEASLNSACDIELECELLRRLVDSWDVHGENQYKLIQCMEEIVSNRWAREPAS